MYIARKPFHCHTPTWHSNLGDVWLFPPPLTCKWFCLLPGFFPRWWDLYTFSWVFFQSIILTRHYYPIANNKQILLRTEINYQALVKAERGSLEAVLEIVGSTLHGIEQRVRVCLCLKVGIQDLVKAARLFFTRSMTGKFLGLKIIRCGRIRFSFKVDYKRKEKRYFLFKNCSYQFE